MRRLIIVLMLVVSYPVHAFNDSERIQGVAEFLIDRANDNYLYIFEKKIKENSDFACYFPNTRENLEVGGLKALLLSRGVWRDSIEKDLELLAVRSLASQIEQSLSLSQASVAVASEYFNLIQLLEVEYQGKRYPLNFVSDEYDEDLLHLINGFYGGITDIVSALSEFRRYRTICDSPKDGYQAFRKSTGALINLSAKLNAWAGNLQDNAHLLHVSDEGRQQLCGELNVADAECTADEQVVERLRKELVNSINKGVERKKRETLQSALETIEELLDMVDDVDAVTAKVIESLKLLKNSQVIPVERFNRLSRYITFFAQISDSESAVEVKQILEAYTLPAVSFYLKREPGDHWMISSYLGLSYAEVGNDGSNKEANDFGIFAPIGLEYSRGLGNGDSVSLMVSPFDFGYPVNLKLNGIEEDVELDEIAAPSITLGYGFRDYPLILGLGYQKGRKFDNESETEERWLIFFSFDMPLLLLH